MGGGQFRVSPHCRGRGYELSTTFVVRLLSVATSGIYRVFYVCYMLVLLHGTESAYAQTTASVPVTITLEEPSETGQLVRILVNRTTLPPLKMGGPSEKFTVSLSRKPTRGQQPVITIGRRDRGIPFPRSLFDYFNFSRVQLFIEAEDWNKPHTVTVSATTIAVPGNYLLSFGGTSYPNPNEINIREAPEIDVTIEDWLEINFSSPWEIYEGKQIVSLPVNLTVEEWFTDPIKLTLFIPNKPDYLRQYWPGTSDRVLTFTQGNYNDPQEFSLLVGPGESAGVGQDYPFVVTASRAGYNNIEKEGIIHILPNPCRYELRVVRGQEKLNFGTWVRPERDDSEGTITVNSLTGSYDKSSNMNTPVNEPISAKLTLNSTDCLNCQIFTRLSSDIYLSRTGESETIPATLEWTAWHRGILIENLVRVPVSRSIIRPTADDGTTEIQIGGTLSDISGDEFVAPAGEYSRTITVGAGCFP